VVRFVVLRLQARRGAVLVSNQRRGIGSRGPFHTGVHAQQKQEDQLVSTGGWQWAHVRCGGHVQAPRPATGPVIPAAPRMDQHLSRQFLFPYGRVGRWIVDFMDARLWSETV